MTTPEQQSVIDTIKPDDLVLISATPENWSELLKVKSIDSSNGTVYVWEPRFSIRMHEPYTWSISGLDLLYTDARSQYIDPALYDEDDCNAIPDPASLDLNSPSGDDPINNPVASDRKTLQPLHPLADIHINPTGVEVMKLYWGQCPYDCSDHMFCPGSKGVEEDFPDLFMACETMLSCPVCMGYEFSSQDKRLLEELLREMEANAKDDLIANLVKERCIKINTRREELGYDAVSLESLEEIRE